MPLVPSTMAERIVKALHLPLEGFSELKRGYQERREIHRRQETIKDILKEAKAGMKVSLDAGALFWTDVLRYGPQILLTPSDLREQISIPDRFPGYSSALKEAFSSVEMFQAFPQLSEEQLLKFHNTLRQELGKINNKVFARTTDGRVSFASSTNTDLGHHSLPLERAITHAHISAPIYRFPERLWTRYSPGTLDVIAHFNVPGSQRREFTFDLTSLQ